MTEFNVAKVAARMKKDQCTLAELGIKPSDIRKMKDEGYRIWSHNTEEGRLYYISSNEQLSHFISKKQKKAVEHRWLELSDLHVGCKQFDEEGLRHCLQRAVDEGYERAFISGDLTDGNFCYRGQSRNLRYSTSQGQADYLTEILMDYDLEYYAIKGNHDEAFEKAGAPNPGALVEARMYQEGGSFTFFDSQAADVIIGGTLKRMVHLSGGGAYAKSYPAQVYIRNLLDSHGENVKIGNTKYRLRFLQCGHFHSDICFETAGIHVTHPGNFQFPNDFTIRKGLVGYQGCRFTQCVITNGNVTEFSSKFIKAR